MQRDGIHPRPPDTSSEAQKPRAERRTAAPLVLFARPHEHGSYEPLSRTRKTCIFKPWHRVITVDRPFSLRLCQPRSILPQPPPWFSRLSHWVLRASHSFSCPPDVVSRAIRSSSGMRRGLDASELRRARQADRQRLATRAPGLRAPQPATEP